MRVAFTGGGTGGHIYPAIAIADALRERYGADVLFVGTADRLESKIVPKAGYALRIVASRPLVRKVSVEALQTMGTNAAGIAQALGILRTFNPDIVIATGGYVCFPVMTAARILRTLRTISAPLVLVEPNAQPGLTNRLLTPLIDEIWTAFSPEEAEKKVLHTGIPVRASLYRRSNRIEAARRLGLDPSRRTILAVGGSQGARTINETVAALVTRRALPPDWQILHISGDRDYEYMRAEERKPFGDNKVVLVPYLDDMADAYALAELAIARAGASTLGELMALGVPAVLVPYPYAAENHQAANAQAFARHGGAVVIADKELDADRLWWTLSEAMAPAKLEQMRGAVRSLSSGDPLATILARVDALTSRRGAA